jgi:hypothetical protein
MAHYDLIAKINQTIALDERANQAAAGAAS